jgi:hypothetical protein
LGKSDPGSGRADGSFIFFTRRQIEPFVDLSIQAELARRSRCRFCRRIGLHFAVSGKLFAVSGAPFAIRSKPLAVGCKVPSFVCGLSLRCLSVNPFHQRKFVHSKRIHQKKLLWFVVRRSIGRIAVERIRGAAARIRS